MAGRPLSPRHATAQLVDGKVTAPPAITANIFRSDGTRGASFRPSTSPVKTSPLPPDMSYSFQPVHSSGVGSIIDVPPNAPVPGLPRPGSPRLGPLRAAAPKPPDLSFLDSLQGPGQGLPVPGPGQGLPVPGPGQGLQGPPGLPTSATPGPPGLPTSATPGPPGLPVTVAQGPPGLQDLPRHPTSATPGPPGLPSSSLPPPEVIPPPAEVELDFGLNDPVRQPAVPVDPASSLPTFLQAAPEVSTQPAELPFLKPVTPPAPVSQPSTPVSAAPVQQAFQSQPSTPVSVAPMSQPIPTPVRPSFPTATTPTFAQTTPPQAEAALTRPSSPRPDPIQGVPVSEPTPVQGLQDLPRLPATSSQGPPGLPRFPPGRFGLKSNENDVYDSEDYVDMRLRSRQPASEAVHIEPPPVLPASEEAIRAELQPPPVPGPPLPPKPVLEPVVPEGHRLIDTEYGSYVVPKYEEWDAEAQQRCRATFELRFEILNQTWNGHGIRFVPPKPEETLTNVHVRYKQSVRYVMARSGVTMWKLILVGCWAAFEAVCCRMGLKASGYTESQLRVYEIYNSQLVELGEISGFGEDWPAWLKLLVISVVNAVIFIAANSLINGAGGASTSLMKLVSQFIMGSNPMVNVSEEDGVPRPADNPLGGLKVGGFDLSNLGGMFSMLTGAMGGNRGGGGGATRPGPAPANPGSGAATGAAQGPARARRTRGPPSFRTSSAALNT